MALDPIIEHAKNFDNREVLPWEYVREITSYLEEAL